MKTIKEIMEFAEKMGKTLTKEQAKQLKQSLSYSRKCRDNEIKVLNERSKNK